MSRQSRPSVAQLINQSSRLFSALGDARLRPLGFRYAQVPVLASLRDGKALTQADLVRRLGVEQSSMAQLLARMERDGVIERSPHEDNARVSRISTTSQTSRRLPRARELLTALDAAALRGLHDDEVRTLFSLLERVRSNLEQTAGED